MAISINQLTSLFFQNRTVETKPESRRSETRSQSEAVSNQDSDAVRVSLTRRNRDTDEARDARRQARAERRAQRRRDLGETEPTQPAPEEMTPATETAVVETDQLASVLKAARETRERVSKLTFVGAVDVFAPTAQTSEEDTVAETGSQTSASSVSAGSLQSVSGSVLPGGSSSLDQVVQLSAMYQSDPEDVIDQTLAGFGFDKTE